MEFLRFGSSIPGSYWGCCAVDIIQNFKVDPDEKASIQLVSGDGGGPVTKGRSAVFAGPTYRDIFWQRLRYGTFDNRDMPNHAFIAVLTADQIKYEGSVGRKWLAILREAGFEFVRTVANSVYTGQSLSNKPTGKGQSLNHIFALFRNIGSGGPADPFTPPKEWQELPKVKTEAWSATLDPAHATQEQSIEGVGNWLARHQHTEDKAVWDKIGPAKFFTEAELERDGVPVTYAGLRSKFPQQSKAARDVAKEAEKGNTLKASESVAPASPW